MKTNYFLAILTLATSILGCTQANPELVTELSSLGFQLNTTSFTTSNPNTMTLSLSGTANAAISEMQVSFDNGATWQSAGGTLSIASGCTSCSFSYSRSNAGSIWSTLGGMANGSTVTFFIRGTGSFGNSPEQAISVTKTASNFKILGAIKYIDRGTNITSVPTGYKIVGSQISARAVSGTTPGVKGMAQ